jgi:hypothetical protein
MYQMKIYSIIWVIYNKDMNYLVSHNKKYIINVLNAITEKFNLKNN